MFTKLLSLFTSLFTKNKVGLLLQIMLAKAASVAMKEILDPENQKKAYEFVKDLNSQDLSNYAKAKIFNQRMLEWAKSLGKKMSESTINCLREMAVNVAKAEKEQ